MRQNSVPAPLPHDHVAERAFLGGVLLSPSPAVPEMELLSCADFFVPAHRLIFRHMLSLKQRGKPTNDSVLLYDSIGKAEELEVAGGVAFISHLPDGLPKSSNLAYYAEIIKTKSVVRQRLYLVESLWQRLASVNGNASEVLREVSALSAPLREEVAPKQTLAFKTGLQLAEMPECEVEWILRGFVAKGALIELGARSKPVRRRLSRRWSAPSWTEDLETTLNTYMHVIPASQRRAVEHAGVLFSDVLKLESGTEEGPVN
jgi:hypothetical protein